MQQRVIIKPLVTVIPIKETETPATKGQYYQLQTFCRNLRTSIIHLSKILRFTGKFIDIYIPYAMKFCR